MYLPAVLLVSAYWGLSLGLATSLLSAAAFNFFHLPPVGRFTIADSRNWVALAAFTMVARRGQHDRGARPQPRARGRSRPRRGRPRGGGGAGSARRLGDRERARGRPPGGSPRRSGSPSSSIELGRGGGRPAAPRARAERRRRRPGRDAAGAASAAPPTPSSGCCAYVVPALGALVAIALRRDALQAEAVETAALRRSDDVKTALLRAVSHDLRTPVTAIVAAGHALGSDSLTAGERAELSTAVVEEGEQLAALVDKLLDLSRLQAGRAEPRRDWVSLEDVAPRRPRGPVGPAGRRAADDRPRRAAGQGRRRPPRAGVRQPARERRALLGRAARCRCRSAAAARGWSRAWSTRGRGSARPSARGSSSRSTAVPTDPTRVARRGPGPVSAWRSRRGSSRPTAARSRSSRSRARARASWSRSRSSCRSAAARGRTGAADVTAEPRPASSSSMTSSRSCGRCA